MNTDQRFIRRYLIRSFRELENERSGCQEGGGGSEKVLEVLLVYYAMWGKRKEAAPTSPRAARTVCNSILGMINWVCYRVQLSGVA